MTSIKKREAELGERFIASFEKLDDMSVFRETDPVGWSMATDEPDEYGFKHWRPIRVETPPECLEPLYSKLPARLPPLFERLVLSYRWAEVDLQLFTLLANPPGPDLKTFSSGIVNSGPLSIFLVRAGYIQFGKGSGGDYDPVCFDVSSRKKNRDCRVVKIDHEEILCNDRLKIVAVLASSFEQLVVQTIEKAENSAHT